MTSNLEQEEVSLPNNWTVCIVNEAWEYYHLPKKCRDASLIDEEMSSIVAAIYLLDPNATGQALAFRCTPINDPDAEPMPVICLMAESLEVFKTAPATNTPVHIYLKCILGVFRGFIPHLESRMATQDVSDSATPAGY